MSRFEQILQKYSSVNTHQGTDKNTSHSYGPVYEKIFSIFESADSILEIGFDGGASLLAYADYFNQATIHGIDIEENRLPPVKSHPRIQTLIADATLSSTINHYNKSFDIIIEDASHRLEHQIQHFRDYCAFVKPGGVYIIEDVAEVNKDALSAALEKESERNGFTMTVFDLRPIKGRFDDILFVFQKCSQRFLRDRFFEVWSQHDVRQLQQLEGNMNHVFNSVQFQTKVSKEQFLQWFYDTKSQESKIFFTKLYENEEWRLFLELYLYPSLFFAPFFSIWNFPLSEYKACPKPFIPRGFKRVSIDVGMAFNGPNTSEWVKNPEMFVLGFEPNPTNLKYLHLPYEKTTPPPNYPYPRPEFWLDSKYIEKQVQIFGFALSNEMGITEFYCTNNDPGTSSIYKPIHFDLEKKTTVAKRTLSSILVHFPWDRIPIIDHLKIDAQGHDFEILLGALSYLDRVAYLNVEMSVEGQYEDVPNKFHLMNLLLQNRGFQPYSMEGGNCSYFNIKLKDYCQSFKPQFIDL